jgi:hypothetical protein
MKRFKPASRGRALPFQKKTANILVEVTGELKPKKAAPKATEKATAEVATKKPAAKPAKKEEKK